ncbi:aspartate/glutamate racemase family protein [Rhodoligotrophos ferricapiens]|uniref:aspartate/glutamate racemase family protein n=1 Tax=Rhodoligotrophos ferricapiens TaxID=3069264 RepID=UPI00315CBED1
MTAPARRRVLHGGHNIYGHRIGILLIEGHFPRPPGAIGNAASFPFPVLHHVVKGFSGSRTVRELGAMDPDSAEFHEAIRPWLDGAQSLVAQGCRAITTSCGFAALFQKHLCDAVDVPVFASSLMLAPMISRMLKSSRRLGIITAEAASLTDNHLRAAGISDPVVIVGVESCPEFAATAWDDRPWLDFDLAEAEVVDVARAMVERNPEVGAILLECSLLPPYAAAVQEATGLPVFDFTHLVAMVHNACARHPFSGLT